MTLNEFISEIETTFSNYSDTNDIDKISIKRWVIMCLREFGKNICERRETIVNVENGRALLPETFKNLILAIRIDETDEKHKGEQTEKHLHKQYIENPVIWDRGAQEYIVNNCESKIMTEYLITQKEHGYEPKIKWLHIAPTTHKDTLDVDCLNLKIRETSENIISINDRQLIANFKEGDIYIQYNSLPADENGEVVIPEITTGDILSYIENCVKIKIAENLIINNKNPQALQSLLQMWIPEKRALKIKAKSEALWNGLPDGWEMKILKKNRENTARFNLFR